MASHSDEAPAICALREIRALCALCALWGSPLQLPELPNSRTTPATVMALTLTAREGLTGTTYHLGRENGNGSRRSRRTQLQGFAWILPATGDYPAEGIRIQHKGASLGVLCAVACGSLRVCSHSSRLLGLPDAQGHVDALTASYNGLRARADLIASLEQQLKTARLAGEAETLNSKDIVRAAARYCESSDNTDEGLASAGWNLRRPAGPSLVLPAPGRLV